MKNKIGIVAGDLFWSSIPYDSLNVQDAFNRVIASDIIMFEKDIRLNKILKGDEKYSFVKDAFSQNKRLITIKDWNDLIKLSNDYDLLVSSAKLAPKTRYPHSMFSRLRCPIGAWDVGGADILTDTAPYNYFLLKGPIWKEWIKNINPTGLSFVTGTPHYDYYYDDFCGFGKPLDSENFHKKYNIQKTKKKILITPSNPMSHTAQFKDNLLNLEKLSKIAQTKNYELLVKTYPHDYVYREDEGNFTGIYKRPNSLSSGKTQYEYLAERFGNIKILESQDHFSALKNVDLVFNMSGSHIAWETYLTKSISFSMNYASQPYFNNTKCVTDYVIFHDDIINK